MLGSKLPRDRDELNQVFAFVKGDVESLDAEAGTISIEVKDSNHPDLWCVEGIARSLRLFIGKGRQQPITVRGKSGLNVLVDRRLKSIRPYIACAVVKNLRPSEEALKSWIGLQDKMDQTYGRKRRKASIGFYQADLVKPPIHYTVSKPEASSFVPLGSTEKMSLKKIIETHDKGLEYGAIISQFDDWPLLLDGQGQILSMPPIINSNDLGKITAETRNILIEVTGTDLETVQNTLKVVVAALSERGGNIYSCVQSYKFGPSRQLTTPDLSPTGASVSAKYAASILGTNPSASVIANALSRAGYRVRRKTRDSFQVEVPCYRLDIMHQVDIIEDIAIALDLNKFGPEWPQLWTPGGVDTTADRLEPLAEVMVGLGYQEVLTYALTNRSNLEEKMRGTAANPIELKNPKMTTYNTLRNWLLPSILEFLSNNTHVDYPQKIFEVGPCEQREKENASPVRTVHKLAAATIHANAGFTEIKGAIEALLSGLGLDFSVEPSTHPSFLEGRFGNVLSKGKTIGFIGEVHPEAIRAWALSLPVAAFELDASAIIADSVPA